MANQKFTGLFLSFILGSLALTGCSKKADPSRAGIQPDAHMVAPKMVDQSLGVAPDNGIVIQKASLKKEFLLMGSLITEQPVPSFSGLKSRVVAFRQVGDQLYMLDLTGGPAAGGLSQNVLLANFPIVKQSANTLTIDFNAGMSSVFVDGDWFSQEDVATFEPKLNMAKVLNSYIDDAHIDQAGNLLSITQIAQIQTKDGGQAVDVRYYLKPYEPDPSFQPVLAPNDLRRFGYFEVAPQMYADGSTYVRAAHFDIRHPIIYAISANTPKDFRQAVRDGVLYWNKAFGRNVMQVVQLTDSKIQAPNPDYNIIQWVRNDKAGFAYADAQMDPRSGQVLHAQIYLTSVFGSLGRIAAQRWARMAGEPKTAISLSGFESPTMCDYAVAKAAETMSPAMLTISADRAIEIAQDYVRETVAHEVGHTLGLRHNFAGNLAETSSLQDRQAIMDGYLRDGSIPKGWIGSSSVMEYEAFDESALEGHRMVEDKPALPYDEEAIQHLYFGKKYSVAQQFDFCTDGDEGKYADCATFDVGQSAATYRIWNYQSGLKNLPETILEKYISAVAPQTQGDSALPVADVALDPANDALSMAKNQFSLLSQMSADQQFIKVEFPYPFVSSLDLPQIEQQAQDSIEADIQKWGGLNAVLADVPEDFAANSLANLKNLLDGDYGQGVAGDENFKFSAADKATIEKNARLYFEEVQKNLTRFDLEALSGASYADVAKKVGVKPANPSAPPEVPAPGTIASSTLSSELLDVIAERIDKYVFTTTGGYVTVSVAIDSGDPKKVGDPQPVKMQTVSLPIYKYPFKIRLAAAKLLAKTDGRAKDPAWGLQAKARFLNEAKLEAETALGAKLDAVDVEKSSLRATQWLTEAQAILAALK